MRALVPVGREVWAKQTEHNTSLLAAGIAFYALLATFPMLIALMTIYGLAVAPEKIEQQLKPLTDALPAGAEELITTQLVAATRLSSGGLTFGLVISLLVVLWAAAGGVRGLTTGLEIIFEGSKRTGFVRRATMSLALTIGAILAVIIALALVAAFPVVLSHLHLDRASTLLAEAVRWITLIALFGIALAVLYRFGVQRPGARWRWVTWGTATATVLQIVGSVGFSFYVSNFGHYNKTYGSLAGVIVFMLWLNLSSYGVLLGAQVDAVVDSASAEV